MRKPTANGSPGPNPWVAQMAFLTSEAKPPPLSTCTDPDLGGVQLPPAGERAALARWKEFLADGVSAYAETRNRPGVDGTSRLSAYLKYGCLHPRTVHSALGHGDGERVFAGELVWRDF